MKRPVLLSLSMLLLLAAAVAVDLHASAAIGEKSPAEPAKADAPAPAADKADKAPPSPAEEKKPEKLPIVVDLKKKTVTLPATVAEQGKYAEHLKGAIEYLLVGAKGKTYETVFVTDCPVKDIHAALLKVDAKPGAPAGAETPPQGTPVNVFVEYTLKDQKPVRRPADEFVLYIGTDRPLKPQPWIFTGSAEVLDPATDAKVLQATTTHSVIGLHYGDASPLIQNPRQECRKENIYGANLKELPPPGTAVRLVFELQAPRLPEGLRRAHCFLSGRVQGVGFEAWAVRQAGEMNLTGWVRSLPDGRIEAVIEGPQPKVDEMLRLLGTGPRMAKVEKVDVTDEAPQGDFTEFTRRN